MRINNIRLSFYRISPPRPSRCGPEASRLRLKGVLARVRKIKDKPPGAAIIRGGKFGGTESQLKPSLRFSGTVPAAASKSAKQGHSLLRQSLIRGSLFGSKRYT